MVVSRRRVAEQRAKAIPVSVTLEKELYDFVETRIDTRQANNRSHAVNQALGFLKWILETNPSLYYGEHTAPSPQQGNQPQHGTNQNYPR